MTEKSDSIEDVLGEARTANERARQLAASLRGRRSGIAAERDALLNRNTFLARLPLRRDDAKEALMTYIDDLARGFVDRANWANTFTLFAYPQRGYTPGNMHTDPSRRARPLCLEDIDAAKRDGAAVVFSLNGATLLTSNLDGGVPRVDALCFFFGDVIKRKIEERFDEVFPDYRKKASQGRFFPEDWAWQDAPAAELETSAAQRRAEIVSNGERVKQLNEQISEIDDDLARLGAASSI